MNNLEKTSNNTNNDLKVATFVRVIILNVSEELDFKHIIKLIKWYRIVWGAVLDPHFIRKSIIIKSNSYIISRHVTQAGELLPIGILFILTPLNTSFILS